MDIKYKKWGVTYKFRIKYDNLYIIVYNSLSFILGKCVTLHLKPEKKASTIMLREVVILGEYNLYLC